MGNENRTREINVKYMFVYAFRHWRRILCVGMILAVLLCAYSGLSALDSFNSDKVAYEKALSTYNKELATYNSQLKSYETQIEGLENNIEKQTEYLEKSLLVNLDYTNKAQANASIFFTVDEAVSFNFVNSEGLVETYDPVDSVITLFYNNIYYGTNWTEIASRYNTEAKYIEELVSYELLTDANILSITVSHSQTDVADTILDEVISVATKKAELADSDTVKYTVSISESSAKYVNDKNLLTTQTEAKESIAKASEKLATAKSAKNKLVKPTVSLPSPTSSLIKNIIIFAVIGFVVGAALVAGIYALIYCLGDRVHSVEEFLESQSGRILGQISISRKKCLGKKLDRFIESFVGAKSCMTDEQKNKLLVYNLKNTVNPQSSLLLIGSAPSEAMEVIKNIISEESGVSDISVEKDILINADSYSKISDNEIIISVEAIDGSKYTDIFHTEALINAHNKQISGYILIQ